MKKLIVANWKCNPTTLKEAKLLFNSVKNGVKNIKNVEVVICPPFIYLSNIQHLKSDIQFGAQDCFWEQNGAFTGEISPSMLKDLGVDYVIIGHSERRKYQQEKDSMINKKIKAALKIGLKPILCIDKTSQIRKLQRSVKMNEVHRLKKDFWGAIIAYEPLFAIGTGKPCSVDKAKKMRIAIKKKLNKNIPILYGGSVDSQNARDYVKKAGFQGLLVGGASLNAQEFIKIVKNVAKA
ncbi:triose-phosphate isomerase [bacterium]|uniref:Triosephosphate isomerase n=3 Tax=Candidatus Nealsoniibacteriota TaxID=1817911 RepID=A0A2M7EBG3_9BACT|nr:triose-phosphate isomerase [bacterium]PIV65077.1 MAG: triose-phosphate isomerase [Candidatus Nealsonbacteria bacterium CG01_land_8_20_14_3_00_12]PJA82595.1 MAG: triose-phosphate isomerase [Candidatus Nealsonbacteria bacterium CG_4_9_14_3_um_filter_37_29]